MPLFRDPARATSPPLTAEAVAAAEAALGVTLPAAYLEALREVNGGTLRRSLLPLEGGPFAPGVAVPYLLGVGGPGGLPGLQALAARWRYPVERGVLLSSAGPRALLLDVSAGAEPAAVFVDMTRPPEARVARVAADTGELLARLVDGSPHATWALAPALTLHEASERLRAGGWTEGERHYGVHRFLREGAELRVEPNLERDGAGLRLAEHADCPLVARLVEPGPREEVAVAGVGAALGVEALLVHVPHPAARRLAGGT